MDDMSNDEDDRRVNRLMLALAIVCAVFISAAAVLAIV